MIMIKFLLVTKLKMLSSLTNIDTTLYYLNFVKYQKILSKH